MVTEETYGFVLAPSEVLFPPVGLRGICYLDPKLRSRLHYVEEFCIMMARI